jgi:hypothetical protein
MNLNEAIKAYNKNGIEKFYLAVKEKQLPDENTLNCAILTGNSEIIEWVLNNGGKPNEDTLNCTLLNGNEKFIDYALENKCPPNSNSVICSAAIYVNFFHPPFEQFLEFHGKILTHPGNIKFNLSKDPNEILMELKEKYGPPIQLLKENENQKLIKQLSESKKANYLKKHNRPIESLGSGIFKQKIKKYINENFSSINKIKPIDSYQRDLVEKIGEAFLIKWIFLIGEDGIKFSLSQSTFQYANNVNYEVGKFVLQILRGENYTVTDGLIEAIVLLLEREGFKKAEYPGRTVYCYSMFENVQDLFIKLKTYAVQHIPQLILTLPIALERFNLEKYSDFKASFDAKCVQSNLLTCCHEIIDALNEANELNDSNEIQEINTSLSGVRL